MTVLSVNLNKIALLRNARGHDYPRVLTMAQRALQAGAAGVTIHPRPDQRHATFSDLRDLRSWIDAYPGCELNVEGYPSEDFLEQVLTYRPHQCTLVPDAADQITSDHGWDLPRQTDLLIPIIARLKSAGIRTSIFINHEPEVATAAAATGTDRVELYTGPYARDFSTDRQAGTTQQFVETALAATRAGLDLNAGHDLDLQNLGALITAIPNIREVSIGHALTVESLDFGWDETIRRYVAILNHPLSQNRASSQSEAHAEKQ